MNARTRLRLTALALACGTLAGLAHAPAADSPKPLDYALVVTGQELLEGLYPDAHTAFITRTLRPMGGHCVGAFIVDDRVEDIQAALRFATNKARVVIVTGGLGPTVNDVTRTALAQFTGIKLQEHPKVLAELTRRFGTPADQLRENLRRQALVPVQGRYLDNPYGTAVGLVFEIDPWLLVALPGPPRELQPMMTNQLVPYLRTRFGLRSVGASVTLRFVGLGQSVIDQTLRQKVQLPSDVIETSVFEGSRVDFTFALPGNSPDDHARLRRLADQVRAVLGDYVYADDGASLEEVVCRAVQARKGRLVLVEAATAGSLAASLARAPTGPQVLTGSYVGADVQALRRLLQIPQAQWAGASTAHDQLKLLGQAAGQISGSDWAIVVGPGEPATASARVSVAFGFPENRWQLQDLALRGSGHAAQVELVTQVVDRFRRLLQPGAPGSTSSGP